MPYIKPEARERLWFYDAISLPQNPGELNYALTRIIDRVLGESPSYEDFNAVIGVLGCAQLELYRRLVIPYEQRKKSENGDVFQHRA